MKTLVLLGTARQGRAGKSVADWATKQLNTNSGLIAETVDLAALGLPFYSEPLSPSAIKNSAYNNPIGKAWAQQIRAADSFVFLVAEYNHSYTPLLKNAIDWLYYEWVNKPVALVSYSDGPIGGARAAEALKPVLIHVGMHVLGSDLHLPKILDFFDESGEPNQAYFNDRLDGIASDLLKYHQILAPLRTNI